MLCKGLGVAYQNIKIGQGTCCIDSESDYRYYGHQAGPNSIWTVSADCCGRLLSLTCRTRKCVKRPAVLAGVPDGTLKEIELFTTPLKNN